MSSGETSLAIPRIDSTATIERTERIAARLAAVGIENYVMRNRWDEPLAVMVGEAVAVDELAVIAEAALDKGHVAHQTVAPEVQNVLPFDRHSGCLLPPAMVRLMDAAVQGALGDDHVQAVRLGAAATGPWVGDAEPHYDYPAATWNYEDNPLQGLNIHLSVGGNGVARFGHPRTWEMVNTIAKLVTAGREESISPLSLDQMVARTSLSPVAGDPPVQAQPTTAAYNAGTNRYTYSWQTSAAWAGTCRQLVIKFDPTLPGYGGGTVTYYFSFK